MMLKEAKEQGEGEKQYEMLSEIVEFAKKNLFEFFGKYNTQVKRMMSSLAFINEIEKTKYHDLIKDIHWDYLTQTFVRDFCKIQGSGRDSGLTQHDKNSGKVIIIVFI